MSSAISAYQKVLDRSPNLLAVNGLVSLWPKANAHERCDMLTRFLKTIDYCGLCKQCVEPLSAQLDKITPSIRDEIKPILKSIAEIQKLVAKAFNIDTLVDYIENNKVDVIIVNYALKDDRLKVSLLKAQYKRFPEKQDALIAKFNQVHYPEGTQIKLHEGNQDFKGALLSDLVGHYIDNKKISDYVSEKVWNLK